MPLQVDADNGFGVFMRLLRVLIYLASLSSFFGMAAGYFGWLHPAFDSFSAFRVHFALFTIISGVVVALIDGRLGGGSFLLAGTLSIYTTLAPSFHTATAPIAAEARYRLLQINVRFDNPSPKQLLQLIAQTKPDIITAQEVTRRWRGEFETITSAYPYQLFCSAHRKIGDVAILSRRPFVDTASNYCGKGASIGIQSVNFGGQIIDIASIHLFWPWPHQQPSQILDMTPVFETLGKDNRPILIAGDLNAPRWSTAARDIAAHSQTSTIHYRGASWLPFEFPARWTQWIGLPIDNVFSSGLIVRSIKLQPNVGSDHLPLLIEFTLPVRNELDRSEPLVG
jgi:endonuclease/exonuclease/phosphatase (EEP) superfamily protein YafD